MLDPGPCLGFLTIDSGASHAFYEQYDTPLGSALADALCSPLSSYVSVLQIMDGRGTSHG